MVQKILLICAGVLILTGFAFLQLEKSYIAEPVGEKEKTHISRPVEIEDFRTTPVFRYKSDRLTFGLMKKTADGWKTTDEIVFTDIVKEGYFSIWNTPSTGITVMVFKDGKGSSKRFKKVDTEDIDTKPLQEKLKPGDKAVIYRTSGGKYVVTVR